MRRGADRGGPRRASAAPSTKRIGQPSERSELSLQRRKSLVSWKRPPLPPRWHTFPDYQRLWRAKPPSPTPSVAIANNLTRGLALAPVTSHRVSGEPPPPPLSSGEPLALRAPAWSMKHMPPTSSPIRSDGLLANHVGKPVISADYSPISRPDISHPPPGVQLDAVALRSRSTLDVRRPVEGSRPAPAPSNS